MADIAQLGFAADTSALKDAKSSLDALVPAADKVDRSGGKLSNTLAKVDKSADKLMAAATGLTVASEKLSAVLTMNAGSVQRVAAANDTAAASSKVSAAATGELTAMTQQLVVVQNELMVAQRTAATASTAAAAAGERLAVVDAELIALTARLATAEQAQAVAQGEAAATAQALAAVHAELAVATAAAGGSAGGAAVGMDTLAAGEGAATTGAVGLRVGLIALLGVVALLAAAVIAIGLVFGAAFVGVGIAVGDVTKGMGLTQKELDKLKDKGVSTTATLSDVFNGLKTTIYDTFGPQIDAVVAKIKDFATKASNYILSAARNMIASMVGAYFTIRDRWKMLPGAIGDLAIQSANNVITSVEGMVNKSIDAINAFANKARGFLASLGVDVSKFQTLSAFKNYRIENTFAGQADKAVKTARDIYKAKYDETAKGLDKFGRDLITNTRKAGQERIRDKLGKGDKSAKGPKSDGAKFEDIVTGAQNDIATQNARAQATTLSAEAAATLEQKTKLLNEAQTKGIALTGAMRAKIDELSAAYGKAKVAADNAIALRDILKGADGDIAGLKSQAELIGLVGRQLAYQTEMQKLLNEAKAKGITKVTPEMQKQFEGKANEYADQSQSNAHDTFMDGVTKGAAERKIALEQERAAIGLNVDQTRRLAIENDLLAQARQKNIDLSPADVAALGQIATEQAATEAAIRKTREAIDFAKDTARGFFKDISDGLRNGKSLWSSFADAAIGALNKIIDKLLNKAIEAGINALFKAFGYADGGVFDSSGVQAYAKGGTFTNSVVDKPTLFASGGSFGVMGEAGPEAIMPLKRGSDGSLGVQMHGGDNGGTMINAPITIQNDNRVTGAVSSADIVALQRASAEQTKAQIARDIPNIIKQYQRDGAIV